MKRYHVCIPAFIIMLLCQFAGVQGLQANDEAWWARAMFIGSTSVGENPEESKDADTPSCEGAPSEDPGECPTQGGSCSGAEPIYLYDGRLYYRHTDMEISGAIPIRIWRVYDTRSELNLMFGYGWSFNYHMRIFRKADGTLLLKRGDHSRKVFTDGDSDDVYDGPAGVYDTITLNTNGTYTLKTKHEFRYEFDANGVLTELQDRNGNQVLFSYDPGGLMPVNGISPHSTISTPIVVAYDYRLTRIEEAKNSVPTGRYIELTYNSDGRISLAEDFTGRQVVYGYDPGGLGDLMTVTDPENNVYGFTYNNHLMTSISDPETGGTHTNVYDSQGRVMRQDHGNSVTKVEYGTPYGTKMTTEIYDDETAVLIDKRYEYYEFNTNACTVKYTRQLGDELDVQSQGVEDDDLVTDYTYVTDTNIIDSTTLPNGSTIDYTHDAKGNRLTSTITMEDATVITKTSTYDPVYSRKLSEEVSSTAETQTYRKEYTYCANGDLHESKRIVDGSTTLTTTYTYTTSGEVDTITDPRGNVTKFDRNSYGYITKIYDPNNPVHFTELTPDSLGNITGIKDANNKITTIEYDDINRITKIINPKNEETILTWVGMVLDQIESGKVGAGSGHITKNYYDTLNRLTRRTRFDGAVEITQAELTYDSEGRVLTVKDGLNHPATRAYDELGRLILVKDALNNETIYEYDKGGNPAKITDANNKITYNGYDYLNRLLTSTQYDGTIPVSTLFTYNAINQVLTVTDAETHVTTNTYDGTGRLIQQEDPMTFTIDYEYDGNNNLTKRTDKENQITEYEYDEYNNLEYVYYGGKTAPVKTVTFTYDNADNMLTWADGTYSATYGHDDLNRILNIATVYPIGTKTVSYTYDSFGNRQTMTYPDSIETLTYVYDELERLQEIKDLALNTTQYDYDNSNRLTKKTLPVGTYTDYVYDNANRLTSLTNKKSDTTTILSSFFYTHDNTDSRLTMTAPDGLHSFGYDDIYRLKTADHPVQTDESYTYDKVGNRKTSAQYNDWNHDSNNRLTDNNGYIYTYDNNGNMITKTEVSTTDLTTYQYDYEKRLMRVDYQGGAYSEYAYDPFGNRIKKDDNGTITWYVYDSNSGLPDVLAEYNNSGALTASYVHGQGMDETLSSKIAGTPYYYLKDGTGSVIAITDGSENIVNTYEYDTFGREINKTGTLTNPYGYTGRRYDTESGLMYYRARYYDPETGRFISADPIGFAGGDVNLYAYVQNNPVNFGDPWGLIKISVAGMGYGHEGHFIGSATRSNPDVVLEAGSGAALLSGLAQNSSASDPITSLSVYSHGYYRGIIMSNNEGFYSDQTLLGEIASLFGYLDQRDIDDLLALIQSGDIVFSDNATIKLFGCNNATGDFAQRLADATGATVIAGRGKVSPINKSGRDSGWFGATGGFYKHMPHQQPVSVGKRIWGR